MNEDVWTQVDGYFSRNLLGSDEDLSEVLLANAAAGLPAIDVSPTQGKLLYLYVKLIAARRVLEIGTLGGYSTLWMARGMQPEGRIVTLELESHHAEVARRNFKKFKCEAQIEVVVGSALESLGKIRTRGGDRFDLVFIDADKVNTWEYFQRALELCRPGALIVADNVVRKGQILEAGTTDVNVAGMQRFIKAMANESRVEATAVQTVGAKGYDGFLIARVRG